MTIELAQRYYLSPSDVVLAAVDFTDTLSSTEILNSASVSVVTGSTVLTVANVSVNSSAVEVLGRSVSIGKAILFKVSGQTLGNEYRVRVQGITSSSPTQTFNRDALFECK